MNIQFSQDLLRYLAVYLGTTLGEIAKKQNFPYSKPYLYKIADGSIIVNEAVNEVFNAFWNDRELTAEDLENIYTLIDIAEAGRRKEKQYQLKKYKAMQGQSKEENKNED